MKFKVEERKNYLSTNEMLADKGYKTVVPTIGSLGQALMKASRENKDCNWLKKQQDKFFTKLRREKKKNGFQK